MPWVQMNVNTILFDSKNSSYIVVLKDESGKKILPIWIGASEGNSIALAMSNVKAARPLTHDLIVSIFDRLEIEIARVVISDLSICSRTARNFISIPVRAMRLP
jgi:bifunctional DNase/RNase